MQTVFVIITFCLAAGFLLKKLVWSPIAATKRRSSGSFKDDHRNCGSTKCGCE